MRCHRRPRVRRLDSSSRSAPRRRRSPPAPNPANAACGSTCATSRTFAEVVKTGGSQRCGYSTYVLLWLPAISKKTTGFPLGESGESRDKAGELADVEHLLIPPTDLADWHRDFHWGTRRPAARWRRAPFPATRKD